MSPEDRAWSARSAALLRPLWRLAERPGGALPRGPGLLLYAWCLRLHRWLWVRGVKV